MCVCKCRPWGPEELGWQQGRAKVTAEWKGGGADHEVLSSGFFCQLGGEGIGVGP